MDCLTIVEAAKLLGLFPRTLRGQANRGKLDATQVGRLWLVQRSEAERYRRENLGRFKGSPTYAPVVRFPGRKLTPHQRPSGQWQVQSTIDGKRRSFYGASAGEAVANVEAARLGGTR